MSTQCTFVLHAERRYSVAILSYSFAQCSFFNFANLQTARWILSNAQTDCDYVRAREKGEA